MPSRLNSDKVICVVLEDNFRPTEEESSKKESDSILVFAKTIDPAQVETLSNFLTCPPFSSHERESFFMVFRSAHAASAEDNEALQESQVR